MKHLTGEELSALLDGELPGDRRTAAERHLEACAECRDTLAELSSQDQALDALLVHDPGDAYFATFPDRVSERIAASGARAVSASSREGGGWRWLFSPRGMALAGSTAAIVIVGGLVWMQSREGALPLRQDEITRYDRAGESAPAPALEAAPEASMMSDAEPSADAAPSDRLSASTPAPAREQDSGKERSGAPEPGADASGEALAEGKQKARTEEASTNATAAPPAAASKAEARKTADGEWEVRERALPGEPKAARQAPPAEITTPGAVGRVTKPRPFASLDAPKAAPPAVQGLAPEASAPSFRSDEDGARSVLDAAGRVRVCGVVRDTEGRPLNGANVMQMGGPAVATSGVDGRFCIDLHPGTSMLQAMSIGYGIARRRVDVTDGAGEVEFRLPAVSVMKEGPSVPGARLKTTPVDGRRGPAAWPEEVRAQAAEADSLSALAAHSDQPRASEAAASAWSRIASRLRGQEPANRALANVAVNLHRAWKLDPTAERRSAARQAAHAYLEAAGRLAPATDPVRDLLEELRP